MNREACLDAVKEIITKDRNDQYGEPEDSFSLIGKLWTGYTGVRIGPADVAAMMILMKVARIRAFDKKEDSWVDIAGYAACGVECAAKTAAE